KNEPKLYYFAIAGSDKKYVWANAKIDGSTVVVWNNSILSPVSVRYAWADNPEGANLYNANGLPASPFEATIIK
ncbi:MAG: sialate O-acetylesterase, partial [Bacteroidia bacterium]